MLCTPHKCTRTRTRHGGLDNGAEQPSGPIDTYWKCAAALSPRMATPRWPVPLHSRSSYDSPCATINSGQWQSQ